MSLYIIIPLSIVISAIAVSVAHPYLVKIAKMKSIVDNPNARRLNKEPIPVLGGVGVFFGIFVCLSIVSFFCDCTQLFIVIMAMLLMLFTGVTDDILNLKPSTKFLMQILAVCLLMFQGGYFMDDLHGLWGIHRISLYIAIPLTLFACVGITNAINLIDGVDGLLSGYGMFIAAVCGVFFVIGGDTPFAILSAAMLGALFPFFMHNVFGHKFKMFIGDGGSLVMGIICCAFVIRILEGDSTYIDSNYRVSFVIAVFGIPIFDTIRVMTSRIMRGKSPFSPDKTHFHHIIIDLGNSHVMTTFQLLMLNVFMFVLWILTALVFRIGHEAQFYLILGTSLLLSFGCCYTIMYIENNKPQLYVRMQGVICRNNPRREVLFMKIQKIMDRK